MKKLYVFLLIALANASPGAIGAQSTPDPCLKTTATQITCILANLETLYGELELIRSYQRVSERRMTEAMEMMEVLRQRIEALQKQEGKQ